MFLSCMSFLFPLDSEKIKRRLVTNAIPAIFIQTPVEKKRQSVLEKLERKKVKLGYWM